MGLFRPQIPGEDDNVNKLCGVGKQQITLFSFEKHIYNKFLDVNTQNYLTGERPRSKNIAYLILYKLPTAVLEDSGSKFQLYTAESVFLSALIFFAMTYKQNLVHV